jgi:DNA polymerase-1
VTRLLFDLEGDGLLEEVTKLHCVVIIDVDTEELTEYGPDEVPKAVERLSTADLLIAHNGLRYDFPVLEKLYGLKVPFEKQRDTLVISRLKHPNIKETDSKLNQSRLAKGLEGMGDNFGRHTIEAWGFRFGIPKPHADIEDWSTWTSEMQERCVGDTLIGLRLWKYLKPDQYSQAAIELEHRVARLCENITAAGWPFDIKKAQALHVKLLEEKSRIERELKAQFGGWWQSKGEFVPKKADKARGYWGEHFVTPDGRKGFKGYPCTKIEWVEFNPSSRQHIARCLKKLGWEPTEFTASGEPKLDDEVIEGLPGQFPQAQGLATYLMLTKRLGQLVEGDKAWLQFVTDEGRIHAAYNPMGTVTGRMAHFAPNIAQVPAVKSPYGHECRELFTVPAGWTIVGADMSGLEGRCFAHYLAKHDGGAYGKALLEGDPHWAVVQAVGWTDEPRDKENPLHTIMREEGAKRLFYAMLYGAGDEKAGRIILDACRLAKNANPEWDYLYRRFFGNDPAPGQKLLRKVGKAAKNSVITGIVGFDKLKKDIARLVEEHGALPGLDKRKLPVRSEHAALNTLLQGAGAVLCKRWQADAFDALVAEGLKHGWDGDFVVLALVHDEQQTACREHLAERVGQIITEAARRAGEPYGFRIPLDSEFKIGKNWAETH